MNLIKKSCDLLIRQEAYVSVRIYDAPELEGTKLLVTKENVFGFVADQELQARLIHSARKVLNKRKSEKKTLESSIGTLNVFFEASLPDETLLIVGAGHIASPLCEMAKLVGFRVVIADDREDYANVQRFPQADHFDGIVCGNNAEFSFHLSYLCGFGYTRTPL
ncbi:MAG: XdhC family protein [Candidatus Aminicenantes bacterium]|jgi:xanthine/CO dehydrogenase XdhC/CoxF family maturation factor